MKSLSSIASKFMLAAFLLLLSRIGYGQQILFPGSTFPAGVGSNRMASTDFNGDGKLDMIIANAAAGSISVRLNNGDGTFGPKTDYASGTFPTGNTSVDVNGDGKPDLVTATSGSGTLRIQLNNGDGTYGPARDYGTASYPGSFVVADVNGDGHPDIVVATYSAVGVLLNVTPPAVLDMNRDGKNDLLYQNSITGEVSAWLMNGADLASSVIVWRGGDSNWKVVGTADADLDGSPDVLLQYQSDGAYRAGTVFTWKMQGTAIVQSKLLWKSSDANWKLVATANLKGDKTPYAILQHALTGAVYYWRINPDFTIGASGAIWTGNVGDYKVVGTPDLNGDGRPDIILQNSIGEVYYWILNRDLTVGANGRIWSGPLNDWKVAGTPDLNDDGRPDILLKNKRTGGVRYWLLGGLTGAEIQQNGDIWSGKDPNWQLKAVTDLTNTGKVSLVFQYFSTGSPYYWNLNGLSIGQSGWLFSGSLADWSLVAPH